MTPPHLELRSVSYRYGERIVLDRISMQARAGEFIALMGANGTGKSTLLDLTANLRRPDAGTLLLDGQPMASWNIRALARRISHLPQSLDRELPFSVEQLVLMGRYPHTDQWHESPADHQSVEQAMIRTGCLQYRHRRVSTLSGGERQRVLLASCLAQEAAVLLLDEPSTFLDIDQQLQCFQLLQDETARNAICIAVTHDLNLALAHCSRIIVLGGNRIAADFLTREAAATPDWLSLFSTRLRLGQTPKGRPWVWCQ